MNGTRESLNTTTPTSPHHEVTCNPNVDDLQPLFSQSFVYFILVLYTAIFIFGILGNLLTCMAVFIHKSMRR